MLYVVYRLPVLKIFNQAHYLMSLKNRERYQDKNQKLIKKQQNQNKTDPKKLTPGHIIIKNSKTKKKEKPLKAARQK